MTSANYLKNASPEQLEAGVAWNHQVWMSIKAQAAGGEVIDGDGVAWSFTPGTKSEGMILFPRLTDENVDDQLNDIVRYYQKNRPEKHIGCWSLDPPEPKDLGDKLLERGFQDGWNPRWMWLDLTSIKTEHPTRKDLRVSIVDGSALWKVDDLPYYDLETETVRRAAIEVRPQIVWHFGAWLGERLVGHTTLCVSTGELGIAGIYDVGVVPEARGQGIGTAVTAVACAHGRALGCRYAMLNGTGEKMYNKIGFKRLGFGKTWWWVGTSDLKTA